MPIMHGEIKTVAESPPGSYDELTGSGRFECMIVKDMTVPTLEQAVEEHLYAEWEIKALHTAMEKLKPYEKELIHRRFWECTDEKTIAAEQHITQQAVNKKLHRILCKLLKLMNCKK